MMPVILFLLCLCSLQVNGVVIVETSHGNVKGFRMDVAGQGISNKDVKHVDMFLGIPYAEPPVGELRFARPVDKSPWRPAVLDANVTSAACPQPLWFLRSYSFGPSFTNVNEDCLYLNIYSPASATHVNTTQYPVMVWIHGGSYRYGSGAEYDGRVLAQKGVVVVTLNYRVGALGFLSTNDDIAPGNYGLLDQLMALRWVKTNIANFRGNPRMVTIFGQSAGGGSVSLHMFSPKTKGLFQSVIPQSGCALSPWAIYRPPHEPRTYAVRLANSLGCTASSSSDVIMCLRHKPATKIANAYIQGPPMISTFAPRVDGYYITDLPEVLLERGEYNMAVQVMTGYVPQETSLDLGNEPDIRHGLTKTVLEDLFHVKSQRYLTNADAMYRALACAYPPSSNVIRNRDYAIDMTSDYGYIVPHIKMAEAMARHGTHVWLYDFTFRSDFSPNENWIGVTHADELYYEFGAPFLQQTACASDCPSSVTWFEYQKWGADERATSRATMEIWAGFAKLGHDADTFQLPLHGGISWPPYSDRVGSILNITSSPHLVHLHKSPGIRFWESYNYLNLSTPVPDVCNAGVPVGK